MWYFLSKFVIYMRIMWYFLSKFVIYMRISEQNSF